MEYVIFAAAMAALLVVIFAKGMWDERGGKKVLKEQLKRAYGAIPQKEYKPERFQKLVGYYEAHPKEGQLDDITWNDLNMDEIFRRMNYSQSASGEEYLYYRLRTPEYDSKTLAHQEEMTAWFASHEEERLKLQLLFKKMGNTGNYSLYDYLDYLGVLGDEKGTKDILLDLLFVPLVIVCFMNASVGLAGLAGLISYNIVSYFGKKKIIDPYITSFAYVCRLVHSCEEISKVDIPVCRKEWQEIQKSCKALENMQKVAGFVMSGGGVNMNGNPLDILMDYVKMAFHIDIIFFYRMLKELRLHISDVDQLVTQAGSVETAICIASFRASLKNGWCVPQLFEKGEGKEKPLKLEEGYHPLLEHPVKNSITALKGVLLTGSNASGKSTFLKTVAINAVLAQTIHTCSAAVYEGRFCHIYSSMALKDNLESGESYYIVEIKALKRILDDQGSWPVICFVDEVLRGTNTVERIAASTQILKSLAKDGLMCFAATHDIELTQLLEKEYTNYHFEEEVKDGDISFNYKLNPGRATTRNAIRLLEIMGYDESIIEKASRQAEHFINTGKWS